MFVVYQLKGFTFCGFAIVELKTLPKIAGVIHEADHAYSIQSTWWLHRLATDVPIRSLCHQLTNENLRRVEQSLYQIRAGQLQNWRNTILEVGSRHQDEVCGNRWTWNKMNAKFRFCIETYT